MIERWYSTAVVYCLDVDSFQDSNGDGVGDLPGLITRLDYLARLGVTCLWLKPIHPTPSRDDGYDVVDYYGIDPRLGTLGDFAELLQEAQNRGIRVIIDLVVNHTSDEHPWFQSARSSRESQFRDWYVWSETEPEDRYEGMVFPGVQEETWTYDRRAKAWYHHRFHDFQPDLNFTNPAVVAEVKKILGFWTKLGVSGFRVDAAPFVIEQTEPGNPDPPKDFSLLTDLRQHLSWLQGDAVFLAEANVEPLNLGRYFGDEGGSANRLHLLFDFMLNGRLVLALARENPEPILEALMDTPQLPVGAQWATFLRNHDEVDLSRLTKQQRNDVFAAFGPEPEMQIYGRGIRRRLAPMLGNDRKRIELAYSLQFTLRGTPVLRYGEELGMGDDLSLQDRNAIRTPLQWTAEKNAGFSTAPADQLIRPVISGGEYGYERLNVTAQRQDQGSLLSWFERMIRTLRECPEVGCGSCAAVEAENARHVLVHRADFAGGAVLFAHNLGADDVTLDLSHLASDESEPLELFADQRYHPVDSKLAAIDVAGRGYRWIRLREISITGP